MKPIAHSYLFVPGNRPERFAKACAAGADAVIVDLEDAVPPTEKTAARTALAKWLSPEQRVLVRINGAETEWFGDDLSLCRMRGITGVVLPKAGGIEDIRSVRKSMGAGSILPLIESAQGFWNALEIARAPGVQRLVFGPIDFQVDLGIRGDVEELLYFRSQLVLVSRLAGIEPPVDGVSTAIDNPEQLRADALRARRLGFGGKLCIHPRQVAHVNECFRPSRDEVAWAKQVVAADAAARGAPIAIEGQMIDRPVVLKARQILVEAGARSTK